MAANVIDEVETAEQLQAAAVAGFRVAMEVVLAAVVLRLVMTGKLAWCSQLRAALNRIALFASLTPGELGRHLRRGDRARGHRR